MSACLLVIDDDRSTCEALAEALHEDGYVVVADSHASRALDIAVDLDPDLILLDVIMPGLEGEEFVRRYREQPGPKAPIVLISALPDLPAIAAGLAIDRYLAKPFGMDQLLAAVQESARGFAPACEADAAYLS